MQAVSVVGDVRIRLDPHGGELATNLGLGVHLEIGVDHATPSGYAFDLLPELCRLPKPYKGSLFDFILSGMQEGW
jgi:hypothetical protein